MTSEFVRSRFIDQQLERLGPATVAMLSTGTVMKTGRHASYPTLVDATSFLIFQDVGYGSRACHCQTRFQSTEHTTKNQNSS